ncbi:acyltransferase [Synechococcus sp. AH-601-N23]|nr:acyltransferase [Synechococcus sp. AH-601-N23]
MLARDIASQGTDNANNASKTSRYRPEIDGLRAFAVVAVIINHFNKDILPGGYLGVDIFFVISGYVITSSLFGRPSKDFKDFISGFYERRIKRLVPALSVFVLITSIAICLFNPDPNFSLRTGIASLFGLSNLYLLKQSTDYFAQSTELNVFTHTWSLGVEEQFYILFPFLIWFSGFGRQTKNGARNLFLIVGALTIASLTGFLYLYPTNQPAAYFLMPSRFWEMAAGCLIFIGFQKRASIEQLLEKVPPLLVMALIVGVMYLPMSMASASTVAVVALSSILIASLKKQTAAFKVFTNSKIVYIGLISYSLYLWHWGVLSISRWTIGIHWWSVPFQVALMLGLAIVSHRWIETPLRNRNWFGGRWKTIASGGGVLIVICVAIIGIGKGIRYNIFGILSNYDPDSFIGVHVVDCEYKEVDGKSEVCYQLRVVPSKKNIVLFGDSHANHLVRVFQALSKSYSFDQLSWITSTANQKEEIDWKSKEIVARQLDSLTYKDLLVWTRSRVKKDGTKAEIVSSELAFLQGISRRTGAPLLIIDSLPDFHENQDYIKSFSFGKKGPKIPLNEIIKFRSEHSSIISRFKGVKNVYYVDPLEIVCPGNYCGAILFGKIIYADSSPHFNKEGAMILFDALSSKITQMTQK